MNNINSPYEQEGGGRGGGRASETGEGVGGLGGSGGGGGTSEQAESSPDEVEKKIKLYKWSLTRSLTINIPFDHFSLLAMLDKNRNLTELVASIFMALLVAVCSALVLHENIYDDFSLVVFCFVVASCHYSLLKSVQPDSSSPIHGFNRLTPLSRPIYFCLFCLLIVFLRFVLGGATNGGGDDLASRIVQFLENFVCCYGYCLRRSHVETVLACVQLALLFFPLLFTLGLFPQVSTFVLCILEQLDMYVFGGTAMNNLIGAVLSLLRSITAVLLLALVLFSSTPSASTSIANEQQFSQSVLFSLYCAFLVVTAYFLSRQSSDLLAYVKLVREAIRSRRFRYSNLKIKVDY